MSCSRTTAVLRLIRLWALRSEHDPDLVYRIGLGDMLDDNVVACVMDGDLFADLDHAEPDAAPKDHDAQRRQELVRQWLAPRKPGSVQ
jgi:hypothetical protein